MYRDPVRVAKHARRALLGLALLAPAVLSAPNDRFADVEIQTQPVGGGVYMLKGAGGNIGVLPGPDGLLMVDDQYAPLAPKIRSALAQLGGSPPRFLLNTHFHGDHVGGNAAFAPSATIFAHENVRLRLQSDENTAPQALPRVTFAQHLTLHVNGERVDVIHFPAGHTDGDSVVWFRNAGVIHMGDHFFNGRFPFVDLEHGGSVQGMLANVRRILNMVPEDIRIIPGHGPLADIEDLRRYRDMLAQSIKLTSQALERGESSKAILARGLPERWSDWRWQLIDEQSWLRTVIADLKARDAQSAAAG